MKSTPLAASIREALLTAPTKSLRSLCPTETRFPWPGQPRTVWPSADISGEAVSGWDVVVEVDDQADPVFFAAKSDRRPVFCIAIDDNFRILEFLFFKIILKNTDEAFKDP